MAFPYVFESTFEGGTNGEWDSESDTGARLDFPHYSVLASTTDALGSNGLPYRGAYCARIRMGDANDHTLTEADIDIAAAATSFFRFYLFLGNDVAATADDTFNVFELQDSANTTVLGVVGLRITGTTDVVEIGVGATAPTTFATAGLNKNQWYGVELRAVTATDATATDASMTLWLDGTQVAQATGIDQDLAVGSGVLGTQNTLATTTGTILLDEFAQDDARLFPFRERFPQYLTFTRSGHAFVGPGSIDFAVLLSATSGNIMRLYDTDTGNVDDAQGFRAELDLASHTSVEGLIHFERGCYVQLTGTNPRGAVTMATHDNVGGAIGPVYYSAWGLRYYGQRRTQRVGNV